MGRMWQTLLLYQWKSVFAWLPVETIIRARQSEYYNALSSSDAEGNATIFVEFMLEAVCDSLHEFADTEQVPDQVTEQVAQLLNALDDHTLSGKALMARLGLKHRPHFRNHYLLPALNVGVIEMTQPDKPNSSKQKYRKVRSGNVC